MTIWEGEPASLIQQGQLQVCSITNLEKQNASVIQMEAVLFMNMKRVAD